MEKKDFPKGTKPREIFVYTCERIAEPLIPLGYKYRCLLYTSDAADD